MDQFKIMKKPLKEFKTIRIDLDLYRALKELAGRENRTLIGQFRHIYETYLKIKK